MLRLSVGRPLAGRRVSDDRKNETVVARAVADSFKDRDGGEQILTGAVPRFRHEQTLQSEFRASVPMLAGEGRAAIPLGRSVAQTPGGEFHRPSI